MAMFKNSTEGKSASLLRCRGSPGTGETAEECKLRHTDSGYSIPATARYDEKIHAWTLEPDTTSEELPEDEKVE